MFETARGSSNQTPKKFQHLLRLADLVGWPSVLKGLDRCAVARLQHPCSAWMEGERVAPVTGSRLWISWGMDYGYEGCSLGIVDVPIEFGKSTSSAQPHTWEDGSRRRPRPTHHSSTTRTWDGGTSWSQSDWSNWSSLGFNRSQQVTTGHNRSQYHICTKDATDHAAGEHPPGGKLTGWPSSAYDCETPRNRRDLDIKRTKQFTLSRTCVVWDLQHKWWDGATKHSSYLLPAHPNSAAKIHPRHIHHHMASQQLGSSHRHIHRPGGSGCS
jgi:hypothetical protein